MKKIKYDEMTVDDFIRFYLFDYDCFSTVQLHHIKYNTYTYIEYLAENNICYYEFRAKDGRLIAKVEVDGYTYVNSKGKLISKPKILQFNIDPFIFNDIETQNNILNHANKIGKEEIKNIELLEEIIDSMDVDSAEFSYKLKKSIIHVWTPHIEENPKNREEEFLVVRFNGGQIEVYSNITEAVNRLRDNSGQLNGVACLKEAYYYLGKRYEAVGFYLKNKILQN